MKKLGLAAGLIAVEMYFYFSRNSMNLELFFFIWAFIFGAFFLFRWVDGDTAILGPGRSDRETVHYLAGKAAETMFGSNKARRRRLPLGQDLVFLALCLVNVALTFMVY